MRTLLIPAAAAALLVSFTAANAASVTGTIKSIDTSKDTVTLQNGRAYQLPSTFNLSSFKPGEKVKLTYRLSKGKMDASAMTPAG